MPLGSKTYDNMVEKRKTNSINITKSLNKIINNYSSNYLFAYFLSLSINIFTLQCYPRFSTLTFQPTTLTIFLSVGDRVELGPLRLLNCGLHLGSPPKYISRIDRRRTRRRRTTRRRETKNQHRISQTSLVAAHY